MTDTPTTDIADWTIDDGEIELHSPVMSVDVRIPEGAITVAVAPGPPRVLVSHVEGGPVLVHQEGGALTIRQPGPVGPDAVEGLVGSLIGAFGGRRRGDRRADVLVVVPTAIAVVARTVSATAMFSGMHDASIDTVSGDVTVSGSSGSLRVHTVSGEVEAASVDGRLSVNTVSGDVTIAGGRIDSFRGHTVSGDVVIDGALLAGDHAFRTVSGDLAMRLDVPDGFAIDATTTSGRLTCGLVTMTVDEPQRGFGVGMRRLRAQSRSGRARLKATSVSGDITIVGRDPVEEAS